MTTTTDATAPRTPWHFWLVAVISLLWNGYGGYDYTMSHVRGEAYYRASGMNDMQIHFMAVYPVWMHAVWAIGVWGSVVGAVLLILRSRWAFHAFAVSTVGAIGALFYTLLTPGGARTAGMLMPTIIVVVCLFFVWFAQTMTKQGVLR
ncbi:MAG TPA: hypothetical protein VF495_01765 [Phenylobacterium sp.]